MAYRTLELTVISAKDLPNVNIFTRMEVYAGARVAGDPKTRKRTPVDKEGGRNPTWNFTVKFDIPEFSANSMVLDIALKSERTLGDRDVGEVHVPVRELLEGWHRVVAAGWSTNGADDAKKSSGPPAQFLSYQVRKTDTGKAKGVLNISYKFSEVVKPPSPPPPHVAADPVTASAYATSGIPPSAPCLDNAAAYSYPPHVNPPNNAYMPFDKNVAPNGSSEPVIAYPVAVGASYPPPGAYPPPGVYPPLGAFAYPPPQQGYGYPGTYPPQGAYGYPPPAGYPPHTGYSTYPPPPQQAGYGLYSTQGGHGHGHAKSKGMMGLGLGAGLIGGAVGGMILGDMVADAVDYDDDGFGF